MSQVALTFDDGPSEWIGPILDVLAGPACVTGSALFGVGGGV